jgi:hypothetical protein
MPTENAQPSPENRLFPNQTPTPPTGDTPPSPAPWVEYVPDPAKSEDENAAAKAEHDKSKPAAAPAPVPGSPPPALAPDQITLPEGFERDDASLGKFTEIMNAELTPQDRANQLIALQAEVMKGVSERANQAFIDMQQQWQDEIRADPALGGEKLDPATGAGNNPHMIRFLHGLADKQAEGKPTPGGTPTPAPQAMEQRFYPSMKQG